MKAIDLPWYW